MKRSLLIVLIGVICLAMAAPAFAVQTFKGPTQTTAAVSTVIGSAVYTPSTNVVVNAQSTIGNYCVAATHNLSLKNSGGRSFGAITSSGIQWQDVSGTSTTGTCQDETALSGTWTAM